MGELSGEYIYVQIFHKEDIHITYGNVPLAAGILMPGVAHTINLIADRNKMLGHNVVYVITVVFLGVAKRYKQKSPDS